MDISSKYTSVFFFFCKLVTVSSWTKNFHNRRVRDYKNYALFNYNFLLQDIIHNVTEQKKYNHLKTLTHTFILSIT